MFAATNFRTVRLRRGKHQSIKIAIKGVLIESILLPSILIKGNYFFQHAGAIAYVGAFFTPIRKSIDTS